ncbi:MAG: sulfite exporter TauE/SafE family protein [Opitutaceae bacterium]|nr:sulfite exporter TauE/SafE family protein [Opitutaceae bacterium]
MSLDWWQWALLALGAFLAGLSKTGIAGLSILTVAIFANTLPARQASGLVLPLLIVGDVVAVAMYRQHTLWRHVVRMFPWAGAGVVFGWLAMGRINDAQTARLIGGILAVMLALHFWRKTTRGREEQAVAHAPPWFAAVIGLLAGFTTLVANAAGPVMILYLLAMRLPKLEFLGTGAVFFMLLNWFKVPFMVDLGLINGGSVMLNLWLTPAVLAGAVLGRRIVPHLNQQIFEAVALFFTAVAAVKLLFF